MQKIKIEYINNTCDVDGIDIGGEILVVLKDGEPVAHHDYSDSSLDMDDLNNILNPFGIDLSLKSIDYPSPALIKKVKKYLKDEGYSEY